VRFPPGRVVVTPAALELLERYGKAPGEYLDRHLAGDWGDLVAHDYRENERALKTGARLFSAYAVSPLNMLWIVTESDRSSTCLLLPSDY
jgi:hypothetical protein